jgi:ATP-dependent exoDNAse (exonuclease V) beta subunit
MHLICTLEGQSAPVDKSYATLLNHFVRSLKNVPEIVNPFRWGTAEKHQRDGNQKALNTLHPDFKAQPNWQKRLWVQMNTNHDASTIAARQEGLLIHDLLAKVSSSADVPTVVAEAMHAGAIGQEEYEHYLKMVNNIVEHPQLSPFFSEELSVFNEKDILIPQANFVRPDRVVKSKDGWVIIDYKTGKQHPHHESQIKHYAQVLQKMTQEVPQCFLVYIGINIIVKSVA